MSGTDRFRIIAADRVSQTGLAPLTEDDRFEVVRADDWDRARLKDELARSHGLIVRSATTVDAELLACADQLRVIGRAGVGVDNIDLAAATARGIPVLNAPAGNTVSAAELTMALILALARRVVAADASLRSGEWKKSRFAGIELRGKTLGLLGAGRIGGVVASRALGFRMKVLAYDPYLTKERAEDLGVDVVGLEELLDRSDIVSLHLPRTPDTQGLVGAAELARMKPSAYLVNVARGGIVDEDALAHALQEGIIAGAAVDVFAEEPLPAAHPLRQAPNTILTPHLGASTAEAQELVAVEIARAVHDALLHGDLSRALNAPAIGGEARRRLQPLLDLGERLGRLAAVLTEGGALSLEVRYAGPEADALKPLLPSVLVGLLGRVVGRDNINFVNAQHLAKSRGIKLTTSALSEHTPFGQFVEVRVKGQSGRTRIAGALLGEHHPRVVRIDDYEVNIAPRGSLLVLRNRDVPGVIGKVGTLLGAEGLNIGEYHQARRAEGGDALAVVSVDGMLPAALLDRLAELPEVSQARVAVLR